MGRVLIVDDDSDIRLLLRRLLERQGWEVEESETGDEALARDLDGYRLFVLDLQMPGTAGDEVAIRLRARGITQPIIFFSAYVDREVERRLRETVANDLHIVAKTDFPKLAAVIHALSDER